MAIKIDVREHPEFAAGYIEGSTHVPLDTLDSASVSWDRQQPLLLICRSGQRAAQAQERLAALGFTALSVLPGGIQQWTAAGNPLLRLEHRPWSIERQVRTAAGSLILISMTLALLLSHYFLLLTAGIGAGLVFAGVSDTCMMGSVLARMPWNRPTRSRA